MQKFNAEIKKHDGIDGAYVEIPFDVEEVFGAKRVKVKATFNGMEYRGSIVRMSDCYLLGITKALRKEIGKEPGDTVEVTVDKDEEVRTIEMPEEFNSAIERDSAAKSFYEALSFSNKRKYFQWITGAKKTDTRNARVEQAIEMLSRKQTIK